MAGSGVVIAQVTTQIADSPGWGAAEWIAIISAVSIVVGIITTTVVQLVRLRAENTQQHAEGRALVTDVRDRLLDLHTSVNHVDKKVDQMADRLDTHENVHHRGKRRW
jgi:uncharacterized protein YlxW (UPF0749 family)